MSSPFSTPLAWDLVSGPYAEEIVDLLAPFSADALRLVDAPAGARIVDVACGPGTLSVQAARAGYVVEALDFSPEMIARFRARAAGLPNVSVREGDGQALPWEDGRFGGGFSMFG